MTKDKKSFINIFCSVAFAAVFVIMLLLNGINWHTEDITQVRQSIEDNFAVFPVRFIDGGMRRVYWAYTRLTGRSISNGVIILNDGRMVIERKSDPPYMEERIDEIVKLNNYLRGKETPFLFIRVPDGMRDNSQLPYGLQNTVTVVEDSERFLSELRAGGVDVLDLREHMLDDDIDFAEVYFHFDHHWNTKGAMYGYGKIGDMLNAEYGFDLDETTWDIDEYEAVTFEDSFIGALTERFDSQAEDITALIPRFSTNYEVVSVEPSDTGEQADAAVSGDFAEIFTPKIESGQTEGFGYDDLNAVYTMSQRYINQNAQNDKKVLFIADSFGFPIASYLSTSIKCVDIIYLNEIGFVGSPLYPMLASEDYDMVLFLLYNGNVLADMLDLVDGRFMLGEPVD